MLKYIDEVKFPKVGDMAIGRNTGNVCQWNGAQWVIVQKYVQPKAGVRYPKSR